MTLGHIEVLLDASALLALVQKEKGSEYVRQKINHAAITSVNYTEVFAKLADWNQDIRNLDLIILHTGEIPVLPVDRNIALEAAFLRPETRKHGLSLGDRICLAAAKIHKLPVMTTDRLWTKLDIGVDVHVIR